MDRPTAFRLGSHVRSAADESYDYFELPIPAARGTFVLFDLRVEHRGGPNRGATARPILYLGYTNRWYRDVANFREPHTRQWAQLNSTVHRALYARLDAQAYVRRLEAELEARGFDVAALKEDPDGGEDAASLLV